MKFPSEKIIIKQIKRKKIHLSGEFVPCIAKFWRKQIKAWKQSYIEMSGEEYYRTQNSQYIVRGWSPYNCAVYVCRIKKG